MGRGLFLSGFREFHLGRLGGGYIKHGLEAHHNTIVAVEIPQSKHGPVPLIEVGVAVQQRVAVEGKPLENHLPMRRK